MLWHDCAVIRVETLVIKVQAAGAEPRGMNCLRELGLGDDQSGHYDFFRGCSNWYSLRITWAMSDVCS